jgi:hydroxysqualene dehydroxylase
MTSPDVAVIGGGFAGLSAAAALAEAGARVLVVDARPQLGGRATAFTDRKTGELVDNGQHVLFGCYSETLRFLSRVGAKGNVVVQPALSIPFVGRDGTRTVLRCPSLPPPLHLLAAVLDWDALGWRDRLAALRLAAPLRRARLMMRRERPLAPDGMTVAAWLDAHRQPARLREWLWEPLAVAALNQLPEEAGAAPFVRVLAEMFGPDPAAAAVVLPTRPLHLMYAEPARAFITAHGGEVRTGALARVVTNDDRATGIDVRGERIHAGGIVAAVPWHALRALFGGAVPAPLDSLTAAASAMASKPIVTVNAWYDLPIMDDAFVGLPGRVMQWVFDKRFAFGGSASHLSLVSSGADRILAQSDAALVATAVAEVVEALPRARDATLVRATVIREKRATFSLAPGQPPRPGTRTAVRGLYLAGDWIDTGLPGTIESAVVSGHRAAREVGR